MSDVTVGPDPKLQAVTEGPDPKLQAELQAAIARAIKNAQSVTKDSKNTFSGYKYASAEAIIEEARAVLAAEGISVIPKRSRLVYLANGPVSTGGKAGMHFADLAMTYKVTHASGGWELCESETPAVTDNGRPQDKAVATASTYSLGYFLRSLLLLPRVDAEHDVDQRDDRGNGNEQRGNGRGDWDRAKERTERRTGENGGNGKADTAKQQKPPEFDVEGTISEIRTANDETLRQLSDDISAHAPKSALPRLRAEWSRRKKEIHDAGQGQAA